MPSPEPKPATAPWEIPRNSGGKHYLRRSLPWLVGVLLLALIAWGLVPKPVMVEVGKVARGPLTVRVSEEGKTRVRNRYIVAAPVSGKMRRVPLKPGDEVKAGETLLTVIEPMASPLLDARAIAQAQAIVSMREASRKQAEESLAARSSASKMAQADRDRMRAITRDGILSDSDRDRMEAEASMRAAEVRAAEFALQVVDYELAQARATLQRPDSATAADLVEVKSPVSGRILKVMQESEMVVASGVQILEIGDPADLEIEAEILSRDAVMIQPGDSVEIEQWGGETALLARVRRIEPAAFTKVSALGVEEQRVIVLCDLIAPPPAAKTLGDRFRVEVRVAVWHSDEVLVVPAGAMFREGNLWKTYTLRDGVAKLTSLQVGNSDGRSTEVLSGLAAGDEVLMHPPDNVSDGSRVIKRQD
jgi:HlyD family secretion protein